MVERFSGTPEEVVGLVNQCLRDWKSARWELFAVSVLEAYGDIRVTLSPKKKLFARLYKWSFSYDMQDWQRGRLFDNQGVKGALVMNGGATVLYWGVRK